MTNIFKKLTLSAVIAMAAFSVQAEEKTDVVIGGGPYLDVPQISQAMDKNLWAKHHVNAEIIPFRSGRAAFEALLGGQLDFALMAEFPAVIGAMREQEFGILAEMSQYQATRIVHTVEGVTSVAGLSGKPIGTTTGTNVHFMLEKELAKAGVKAEVISVSPPDIIPALSRGDVVAGAMFPSFYAGAKKTLGDKYSEIPVSTYKTRFIFVATNDMIKNSPNTVKNVLKALYEGEKLVKSNPAESHEAVSRVLKGTLKPKDIAAAWGNYAYNMKLDNSLLDLMVDEGQWIQARGSIKGVEPTKELMLKFFVTEPLASINSDLVTVK